MNISPSKLKFYRAENGWSQEQVAELCGVSLRTVQRAEKEGRCSQESCMALASAFGVSPAELNDEFNNSVGDGSINVGGILGAAIILSLISTIIAWEWRDLGVFINVWVLAFNILTFVSLSMMTCGFTPTMQALATVRWLVKQPDKVQHANRHLPVLRRLIVYSYTSAVFWAMTDIVEASYYAFNGEQSPHYAYELGLTLTSLLYAVLFAEIIFRPLKNRIEYLLMQPEQLV
ncbi:helix-turn-helix transcriptional regulator [Endozoicomonas sp. G2_1]|uniref:helix-turn-helix transcriptional regulator n=1 Tax=Endozoicomonas sp. G2_1 TaxID=2821091 RepID=UPI001ADA5355|nr:helix-turn-helix transcriptional regulator [Endozoicomonas sp. G2_1]MBO9490370.1 helix-turn-helix transcriptional regulator [Endozoicomonas sp. G2_1]